uniref:Uncharacterized protein n=1 Tax=Anguilla anguilla TaxID=7936 RepID=A0A0E9S823_ANGAN
MYCPYVKLWQCNSISIAKPIFLILNQI